MKNITVDISWRWYKIMWNWIHNRKTEVKVKDINLINTEIHNDIWKMFDKRFKKFQKDYQ